MQDLTELEIICGVSEVPSAEFSAPNDIIIDASGYCTLKKVNEDQSKEVLLKLKLN